MRVLVFTISVLLTACASTGTPPDTDSAPRVLSWNVSGDAFLAYQSEFTALLAYARPDIVLLDEVDPQVSVLQLRQALPPTAVPAGEHSDNDDWHISFGTSGGRQRGVNASRLPVEELPEF